jgi:hypothetical protein
MSPFDTRFIHYAYDYEDKSQGEGRLGSAILTAEQAKDNAGMERFRVLDTVFYP